MTDAVDTATTTVSGTESAPSQAPVTEQAPATPVEGKQQAPQTTDAPAVPDTYAFSNLPEGYVLDDQAVGQWSGVFKELGLTQEQADKLVQMDAQRVLAGNQAAEQQAAQARQQQNEAWVGDLKKDPEFGGANFDANVGIAQKALAAYGSPELTQWLNETGAGSQPHLVKLFHKVGKELQEGSLHRASTTVPAPRTADVLFGHLFDKKS